MSHVPPFNCGLFFERVGDNVGFMIYRARVGQGWLLIVDRTPVFIPDPHNKWDGSERLPATSGADLDGDEQDPGDEGTA